MDQPIDEAGQNPPDLSGSSLADEVGFERAAPLLPPPPPPKSPRRVQRALLWLLGLGAALLFGLLLLLLFLPLNALKDHALPILKERLGIELKIKRIDYSLFSGLDLYDVELPAPQGFTLPLFSAERIGLHYSLDGLFAHELRVTEIAIESPRLNLETRNGVNSIDAWLKALPPSAPSPAEPASAEPEEAPPATASPWRLTLDKLAINDLRATLDLGSRKLDFGHLSLLADGFYSDLDSAARLSVTIDSPTAQTPNIRFAQQEPLALDSPLTLGLQLTVDAKNLYSPLAAHPQERFRPQAQLALALHAASPALSKPWALAPLALDLALKARADLQSDTATVEALTLDVNQERWLALHGALTGLYAPREVDATLEALRLPLARIAPYLKPFLPALKLSGEALVQNLHVKADVPSLMSAGMPELSGEIRLNRVDAAYPPAKLMVSGLDLALDLEARADAEPPSLQLPAAAIKGFLKADTLALDALSLKAPRLDLDVRAADILLSELPLPAGLAGLELSLALPRITYQDPTYGPIALSLQAQLAATGEPRQNQLHLTRFDLNISDTIKLKSHLDARLDLQTPSLPFYIVGLTLEPLSLPKLIALLPPKARLLLLGFDIKGALAASFESSGNLPWPLVDPLALPVNAKAELSLKDAALASAVFGLDLTGLELTLQAQGTPQNVDLNGLFKIGAFELPAQSLRLEDLQLPLEAHLTPSAAKAKLGLALAHLGKEDLGASINGLALSLSGEAQGALLAADISQAKAQFGLDCEELTYSAAPAITLGKEHFLLALDYQRKSREAHLNADLSLATLSVGAAKLDLKDVALKLQSAAQDLLLPKGGGLPAPPKTLSLKLETTLGELRQSEKLEEPLKDTRFLLELTLADLRDLALQRLALLVPSLGASLEVKGEVARLKNEKGEWVDLKTRWPEVDIVTTLGLDHAAPLTLSEGLQVEGQAQLKARLRSLAAARAELSGALTARDFGLNWRTKGQVVRADGSSEARQVEIAVHDFDADVPFTQSFTLDPFAPLLFGENIFEAKARGVLYDAMRPYLKEQANFHIGTITYDAKTGDAQQHVAIDEVALDMLYKDGTFAINRLYVDLLGGGMSGVLQLQLVALPPKPLDARLHLETQVTGINLARLLAKDKAAAKPSAISTLVNLNVGLRDLFLDGRVDFTRISLAQLDDVLKFLDPKGKDPNIQRNRALVNAWYIKGVKPQISLVSMRVKYGNLSMDIKMDAKVVGPLLQDILDRMRIRRFNIIPILKTNLPASLRQPEKEAPGAEPSVPSASAAAAP